MNRRTYELVLIATASVLVSWEFVRANQGITNQLDVAIMTAATLSVLACWGLSELAHRRNYRQLRRGIDRLGYAIVEDIRRAEYIQRVKREAGL